MSLKVHLLDVLKRLTNYNKGLGIIQNGELNTYPQLVERYINNSVTAKTSSNIMTNYISGRGFKDLNDTIVNSKNGTTLKKFGRKLASSLSRHRGAFIHIDYDANYKMISFDNIPFGHCRIGKKDDNDYSGKIVIFDDWGSKVKKDELEVLDVYNPLPNVIQAQVEKAGGWSKYKGQIMFINFDEDYDYPLSTIDPVFSDCDSESQASIYKNKSLRKGFFGKTVIVTKPLIGDRAAYESDIDYATAQNERDAFKDSIDDFIGAENTGGALHVEVQNDMDSLDSAIKFENISSDIDDKMFEYTETSVFKNILMAFNNIPPAMIRADNALFGNSGEALIQMREMYQENIEKEQQEYLMIVQKLADRFKELQGKTLEVEPLIVKRNDKVNKQDGHSAVSTDKQNGK